jgi:hypothetical protein
MRELWFTRVGRFHTQSCTLLGCFAIFDRFFGRLVLAARWPHLIRTTRRIAVSDRWLHLRWIDQNRHDTPPRATREKPGKSPTIPLEISQSDRDLGHFPRPAVVRDRSPARPTWPGARAEKPGFAPRITGRTGTRRACANFSTRYLSVPAASVTGQPPDRVPGRINR